MEIVITTEFVSTACYYLSRLPNDGWPDVDEMCAK